MEWETDRARFLGRGRGPDDPQALDGRSLSGTTGVVLDPDRQPAPAHPPRAGRLRAAVVRHRAWRPRRETALALAQKYHDPSAAARTFALAFAHAQSGLRHLGITQRGGAALRAPGLARALRRRVAARGARSSWPATSLGQDGPLAARHLRRPADPARARGRGGRPAAGAPGPAGAGVLAAQGAERGRRDPERAPGRATSTRCTPQLDGAPRQRALADVEAPARAARTSCAATRMARGRARPARQRGARGAERRARRAGAPARPARIPSATASRRSCVPARRPPSPRRRAAGAVEVPPLALANGTRRLRRRRPRLRDRPRRRPGDAAARGPTSSPTPRSAPWSPRPGSAYTWAENSRENRLTPFANDPVTDPTAEALFVRDDETGEAWSPTPGPMRRTRASGRCVIRHAAGRHALRARRPRHRASELDVFVDAKDPVKFSLLDAHERERPSRAA